MRTIKFRAWDRKLKEWVPEDKVRSFSLNYLFGGDFDVVQFTGLFDKNGKEIYEGDITECENGARFLIEWQTEKEISRTKYSDGVQVGWEEEVIGNVYEHSHLLSTK